jgi:Ca2+-binding RTX toxin-like protein
MAVLTYSASNKNSDAFESFFLPPARSEVFTNTAATVIVDRGGFFNGTAKFDYVLSAGTTNAVRVHSFTLTAPSAPFNNPTLLVSFDADPDGNGSIALNRSLATLHQGGAASAAAVLAGADRITSLGTVGRELNGYAGDDVIRAGSGKDRINGGTGKDTLIGGGDDDLYAVDNAGDKVFELANQGFDAVVASASFVLSAGSHVEELHANDAGNINLTGNALANALFGNAGNNILNGGAGADRMEGRAGNDMYYVDSKADVVVEAPEPGRDTIRTTISYVLSNAVLVETLEAIGAAKVNLTGNFFDNLLVGNATDNVLKGDLGGDTLRGGLGNDTLAGGANNDLFVFDSKLDAEKNVDRIVDFNVPNDTIRLDNAIFTGLPAGGLKADAFFIGGAAHDASDRIIYNSANGQLFFDSNGNAGGGSTHFATLQPRLALTHADFVVF